MSELVANQENKTKMIQPPNPAKTELEKKSEVKVEAVRWIKAVRPIILPGGQLLREGEVAQVPVPVAKEFCLKKFGNAYPFSGERVGKNPDAQPGVLVRAVLVTDKEALAVKAQMAIANKSHMDEDLPEPEELPEAL